MAVEVALGTPLAESLSNVVQPKLVEVGWSGEDDTSLAEYIILMLVNGKTQDQIASELAQDLLPDGEGTVEFAQWLFDQVTRLRNEQSDQQQTQAPPQESIPQNESAPQGDATMSEATSTPTDSNVPTGPKAMRGGKPTGRGGRAIGGINKAMDRSGDSVLHRTRGAGINSHSRTARGHRNDQGRMLRNQQLGAAMQMNGPGMQQNGAQGMIMSPHQQMQLMAMMEEQARMMAQFMPGMMAPGMGGFPNGQQTGRSLSERIEAPTRGRGGRGGRGGRKPYQNGHQSSKQDGEDTAMGDESTKADVDPSSSMEVESSQQSNDAANTLCRFNLKCTRKDCSFAHQSPAAPEGITVDMSDTCSYGAACKNFKCTAKHPSPAQKNVRSLHVDKPSRRSTPNEESKEVAVLGGGITGLAAAYFLTKELPKANVTVIEKSARLGGWLESSVHELDDGRVVFENGPRTLRQVRLGAHFTRELVEKLDLGNEIVSVPKTAPASRNRYLYYPDHLVRMPGPVPNASMLSSLWQNVSTILGEPVFEGLISGLLKDAFISGAGRDERVVDMGLRDFISTRFNPHVADNLASAVIHGIYAGDISKLSARSLLPKIWHLSKYPSISGAMQKMTMAKVQLRPRHLVELVASSWDEAISFDKYVKGNLSQLDNSSVFTFKYGLQQLVSALEGYLKSHPRVTIKLNTDLTKISGSPVSSENPTDRNKTVITTQSTIPNQSEDSTFDYTISTISSPAMSRLLQSTAPHASKLFGGYQESVNVMVVNLFYREPNLVPVSGFGYLIPRTIPFEQNPECALGVIFGSDSSVGQDTATGTKLTVMLGGHWWDDIPITSLPDPETATKMARSVLSRHLGITATPILTSAKLQPNAIPQYTVLHYGFLSNIHKHLSSSSINPFPHPTTDPTTRPIPDGRLHLAGSWYTGVGVNDCITAARAAVERIREGDTKDKSLVKDLARAEWVTEDLKEQRIHWHDDWERVAANRYGSAVS